MYKKGDIILVNFPFSDLSSTKKRPAVVVSQIPGDNAVLCQISTKERKIKDYTILLNKEDCTGDIQFNSFIYLDMIFTLHSSLIVSKLGEISSEKKAEVSKRLKELF